MKKIAYILGGTILTLLIAVLGLGLYVYIKLDNETLTAELRELLTETLQTEVKLKEVRLNPWTQDMAVYGLNIKDRQRVDMLHIDTLEVKVDVLDLLDNRLMVYGFNLSGAHGNFYKERKDTAANYQFAVDALTFVTDNFKKEKKKDKHEKKKVLMVDLKHCRVKNTSVRWDVKSEEPRNSKTWKEYDDNHIFVDGVDFDMKLEGGGSPGNFVGKLKHLYAMEHNSETDIRIDNVDFNGPKKNFYLGTAQYKYADMHLTISGMTSKRVYPDGYEKDGVTSLKVDKISFKRNNNKPKKSKINPKRGDFDPGHLDIEMSLEATATYITNDSVSLKINNLKGIDHESGLQISRLTANFNMAHERCYITNLKLVDQHTSVNASLVNMVLSSKKHPHTFSVKANNVRAHVILKDISRPFTPALKKFTTPLELSTDLTGNEKALRFSRIHVYTKDRRLGINAKGWIAFGKKKLHKKTELGFNILSMYARRGIKGQILGHFANLSPAFVNMLTNAGDIQFHGYLGLPYRHQDIKGVLTMGIGKINADIHLSTDAQHHHFMRGTASSDNIDLPALTGKTNIGPVSFKSSFDLILPRGKKYRHGKKGALPVGTFSGTALNASYKFVKLHNIDFTINSDGHNVDGTISNDGKILDVSTDFSFQGSDIKNTLKVKPHIKFNIFRSSSKQRQKQKNQH